jgi:hypothetical protein
MRHEDIPSEFPDADDEKVLRPPADPVAGQFYKDEVEGVIYIPEEYQSDPGLELGKYFVAGKDLAIVVKKGTTVLPIVGVGWLGYITQWGMKRISGSVEFPPAYLSQLIDLQPMEQILILDREESPIAILDPEFSIPNTEELVIQSDEFLSLPFVARDDVTLKSSDIAMAKLREESDGTEDVTPEVETADV